MPRTAVRWRDLIPGVVAIALLAATAVAVLVYARVGALRGGTFDLVVVAGQAYDIERGTDVWLAGQRVGAVDEVTLRPPSADTTQRILVRLQVLERARPLLRHDSRVEFRTGGSLLGSRVVALSPGTPDAPAVSPGDTLVALPERDLRTLFGTLADVGDQFPHLQRDVDAIVSSLRQGDGTLGAATRTEGLVALAGLQSALVSLTRQLSATDSGSLGPLLRSPDLRDRARRATARADSVRRLVASSSGTLGRFRRDSSLVTQITAVRDEVATVRALVDLPAGSAGRALHDGALAAELEALERELDLLVRDVKEHPLRYVVF
ncbi:MAG TPA: MlaD family protein [Gemmatimonadaceae bacterium]|nr:MlaD family protein [Gemmatimonadaceae bacterium]